MTGRPSRAVLLGLAVFINLVWAFSYPVSKIVMETFSPLPLSCWRLLGGALVLLPFLKRSEIPAKVTASDMFWLSVMGLVGCGAATALQYYGTVRTLSSNIALIVALETVIIIFVSALLLGEKLTRRGMLGLFTAFAGVVLITINPESFDFFSSRYLYGNMVMVVSVVCYASYTIIGKKLNGRWGANALTVIPFGLAGAACLGVYYATDPAGFCKGLIFPRGSALAVAYIVVAATGLSYLIWNWLLRYLAAGDLSKSLYLQPVAGIVFSCLLLGERLTLTGVAGSVLVLAGTAMNELPPTWWRSGFLSRIKLFNRART